MVNNLTKLSSHQVEIFNPIQNKTNQQPQPTYFSMKVVFLNQCYKTVTILKIGLSLVLNEILKNHVLSLFAMVQNRSRSVG